MLRKVILCPNPYRDAQLRVAKEAKRVLDEVGCPNVVCLPFRNQEPPEGYGLNIEPLQQEIRGADMIIAFGGDGTILHLSKTAAHRDIPVLGVNLGSLGFMAELESKDLLRLRDLCDGKYEIESHMMLDVSVQRDGRVIYSNLALNEALIARGNISRDPAANLRRAGKARGRGGRRRDRREPDGLDGLLALGGWPCGRADGTELHCFAHLRAQRACQCLRALARAGHHCADGKKQLQARPFERGRRARILTAQRRQY